MSRDALTRLADRLVDRCLTALTALEVHHLPRWRLPGTFAGHAVGADVRADAIYTLGHLAGAGVDEVGGVPTDDLIARLLRDVRGRETNTFFSYRVAETLLRAGPFAGNRLLDGLAEGQQEQVAAACDSSDWVELLDAGGLPRNYAAVLARCELARRELGLVGSDERLDDLVRRLAEVLGENPRHALDDSNDRIGRYDIYTGDVWLFCSPLASRLGSLWDEGMTGALALVDTVAGPDGAAVPWGRSTGVLGIALSIELAAMALSSRFAGDRADAWARRGLDAAARIESHFDADGVVNAHRHRAQDRYRGPHRRLQLTLDVLGKLAWSAGLLRRAATDGAPVGIASARATYRLTDTLVRFEDARHAAVWVHRSRGMSFVLPFVGPTRSHYLPAAHAPGTFEAPVDADLPCWTPLVVHRGARHTGGGLPDSLEHAPAEIRAVWNGLAPSGTSLDEPTGDHLEGERRSRLSVERRSLVLEDELSLARTADAVTWCIPETGARPLQVDGVADVSHASTRIVVEGIAEWSTPFSAITAVHQLDVGRTDRARVTMRVTPVLRVASTNLGHHYHRLLYEPMADRVLATGPPVGLLRDPHVSVADVDLLHLHWPEWCGFDELAAHEEIIAALQDHGVPVVWTAHNLTPHERRPEVYDPIYQRWADTADAVIHHSTWGEVRMRERYGFRPDCRHEVVPHGHFGDLWPVAQTMTRREAEARLGFAPTGIRVGIVGAPRPDKRTQALLDGFAATTRADVQLACWSLFGERVPDDPRIVVASRYREVDSVAYATRLAACDVLAMPFDPDGDMLATGTAADALGLGLPALVSDWGYLTEVLGDAGIRCGHTPESITACLESLTPEIVHRAAAASASRRARFEWGPIAQRTADLFDRVVLGEP